MIDDDRDDAFDDNDATPFATGIYPDAVATGAAADSDDDADDRLKHLPRLLRYAMLASDNADCIEQRLTAEIAELCPESAPCHGLGGNNVIRPLSTLRARSHSLCVRADRPSPSHLAVA